MIRRTLLLLTLSLLMVIGPGLTAAPAQSAPNIKASIALDNHRIVSGKLVYLMGNEIIIYLTVKNEGGALVAPWGFPKTPFYLHLVFKDPTGNGILANPQLDNDPGKTPDPPPVIPNYTTGALLQAEKVETVAGGWGVTVTIPRAQAYYNINKPGWYSVEALIPLRVYNGVNHTFNGESYANLDNLQWQGAVRSKPVEFLLLADNDGDTYYYPEAFGTTSPDCNDNDAAIHPGATEVSCDGKDNDCNPATLDLITPPAPALNTPADGAANVSPTPTLTWSTSACAGTYQVQLAANNAFSPVLADYELPGTSYTVSSPLAGATTYYWRVNAKNSAAATGDWSAVRPFTTQATGPTGTIKVKAEKYVISLGLRPIVSKSPLGGMEVRAYNKSTDTCVTKYGFISWPHYNGIWRDCTPVATGVTNSGGEVNFQVAPRSYLIMGKYDPNPGSPGEELLVADTVLTLTANQIRSSNLFIFQLANGRYLPGKYTQFTGSLLNIVEPDYVEWNSEKELYPIVFESAGDWTVETSVSPPEGFVSDHSALGATVNSDLKAVQFTITDVGSRWVDTQVKHRIKHKGKWKTLRSKIGVKLSTSLAKKKNLPIFGHQIPKFPWKE